MSLDLDLGLEDVSSRFYEDEAVVIDLDSVSYVAKGSKLYYVHFSSGSMVEISSERGKKLIERWAFRSQKEFVK